MKTVSKIACREGKLTFTLIMLLCSFFSKADQWIPKANYPHTVYWPISFSIGTKGYVGCGEKWWCCKDFWEYDPATDTWSQKADYGGGLMSIGASFSIGSLGYAGLGYDSSYNDRKDFWEYNPATNIWKQLADFEGDARSAPTSFTVGNMGYIGMGTNWIIGELVDLWQYDPTQDLWNQKSNIPGLSRSGVNTFVIGTNAYFAGGQGTGYLLSEFWEYNTLTDTWIQKPDFPFAARSSGISFSHCDRGYIGTGNDGSGMSYLFDFWEYYPITGTWIQKSNYPVPGRMAGAWFIIQNRIFVGVGCNHSTIFNTFFEYIPDNICAVAVAESPTSLQISISPNPANDILIIKYQLKENKNVESVILDANGKVIHEFSLSARSNLKTISIQEFVSGIYFLKAGNEVKQFVIN